MRKDLTPVWSKMREEWADELKNAEQRAKVFKEESDKLKEQEAKAKGDEKAQLKRPAGHGRAERRFLGHRKEPAGLADQGQDARQPGERLEQAPGEAYVLAGFRTVVNQCNKCHQVGNLQAQQVDGRGPSLNLTSARLRPEWAQRWISNPQRSCRIMRGHAHVFQGKRGQGASGALVARHSARASAGSS